MRLGSGGCARSPSPARAGARSVEGTMPLNTGPKSSTSRSMAASLRQDLLDSMAPQGTGLPPGPQPALLCSACDSDAEVITISAGGIHSLKYRALSGAGTVSATGTATVKIDTIDPTTSAKAARGSKGKAITLKYLVNDNLRPQAT